MSDEQTYELSQLGQQQVQELHRDRIAQVYFGETSDTETQRRARERIDWTLDQVSGEYVYDIGCSEGVTAIKLGQAGITVDAIDINPEVIEYAQGLAENIAPDALSKINFFVQDIYSVSEIEPKYDTVILGEVIEHVFEPGNMVKRSILSMKVGGSIIITTPWGYFPAPDHHQTYFLTDFLGYIPEELVCTHLSIVDGYIRYTATKTHDPRDVKNKRRRPKKSKVDMSEPALLRMTEVAALESQTYLREHLSSRNALLEQARAQAESYSRKYQALANVHDEVRKQFLETGDELKNMTQTSERLRREVRVLGQQKLKLSMERGLFPKTLARLRHVRKSVRQQGVQAAARHYATAALRRFAPRFFETKLLRRVPIQVKQKATELVMKQLASLENATVRAIEKAAQHSFVIVCNSFPGPDQSYGGEFIRSRYKAYLDAGFKGDIIHVSSRATQSQVEAFEDTDCSVVRVPSAHFDKIADILAKGSCQILAHSPVPAVQTALQKSISSHTRLNYWFHGFEVRDYRRLYFNYTTEEAAKMRSRINEIHQLRLEANRESFADPDIKKVFVSDYLKTIAQRDMGAKVQNGHIIPNFINSEAFPYVEKTEESLSRFLLIRSFDRRNYANDIAIEAIKILSEREGFDKLHFTIRGFGAEFSELTGGIGQLPNVDVQEQYSTPEQMAKLHADHGVFLYPSRFDTQGVTMGEAMSSGLLCITNAVAGIPEYIDDSCGILVPDNNPKAFAKAIWSVQEDLAGMVERSKAARKRVREQCGLEQTVEREFGITVGKAPDFASAS